MRKKWVCSKIYSACGTKLTGVWQICSPKGVTTETSVWYTSFKICSTMEKNTARSAWIVITLWCSKTPATYRKSFIWQNKLTRERSKLVKKYLKTQHLLLSVICYWSLLLWGEGPQGHRVKPLITQHKQNKRHINKSKQT